MGLSPRQLLHLDQLREQLSDLLLSPEPRSAALTATQSCQVIRAICQTASCTADRITLATGRGVVYEVMGFIASHLSNMRQAWLVWNRLDSLLGPADRHRLSDLWTPVGEPRRSGLVHLLDSRQWFATMSGSAIEEQRRLLLAIVSRLPEFSSPELVSEALDRSYLQLGDEQVVTRLQQRGRWREVVALPHELFAAFEQNNSRYELHPSEDDSTQEKLIQQEEKKVEEQTEEEEDELQQSAAAAPPGPTDMNCLEEDDFTHCAQPIDSDSSDDESQPPHGPPALSARVPAAAVPDSATLSLQQLRDCPQSAAASLRGHALYTGDSKAIQDMDFSLDGKVREGHTYAMSRASRLLTPLLAGFRYHLLGPGDLVQLKSIYNGIRQLQPRLTLAELCNRVRHATHRSTQRGRCRLMALMGVLVLLMV